MISVHIADTKIEWSCPENPQALLESVGLNEFRLKKPCEKRIAFIEAELRTLENSFQAELAFIANFTHRIFWLESNEEKALGSAGFYEVPHGTFFSDLAMFSIPPEIIVPKEHARYAILENLYHEALHHQMHGIEKNLNQGYLQNDCITIPTITLSWRDRTFTLLEALHALHVYAYVTPLRRHYSVMINHTNDTIKKSIQDGLRMWQDLTSVLNAHLPKFKDPWSSYIIEWELQLKKFTHEEYIHGSQL